MEQIPTERYTLVVDTQNARILLATGTYTGGVANVALYITSNVVISSVASQNNIVIYSTGAIYIRGQEILTADFGTATGTLRTDLNTFISTTGPTVFTLGQSTNTFNIWLGTTSIWMTSIAASTTALSASTVSIKSAYDTWTGTTTLQITAIAAATTTLHTENVLAPRVDFSTITTAIAAKQNADSDLDDLSDGSLSGSKVGDGVPAANIAAGDLDIDVIASSVAAAAVGPDQLADTAVTAGTCTTCDLTIDADGRITAKANGTTAGGGDSVKASTETWSGAKSFLSSGTAGPDVGGIYTSTATDSANAPVSVKGSIWVGTEGIVAITSVTATTKVCFYGLKIRRNYKLSWRGKHNTTDGQYRIQFNDDNNSRYQYAGYVVDDAGNVNSFISGGTTFIYVMGPSNQVNNDTYGACSTSFGTPAGSTATVVVSSIDCGYTDWNSNWTWLSGSGSYGVAAAGTGIASVCLNVVTGGTFDGDVTLQELATGVLP